MNIGIAQRAHQSASSHRSGSVIVIFLALLIIISSVGLAMLRSGVSVTSRQSLALDGKNAFYVAESGLAEAYWGMTHGKTGQVGTESDPVYFGGGLFWVDSFPQGDDVYLLQSTGMFGRGSVSLSLAVRARAVDKAGASQGVFSRQGIRIAPGVIIDGYDSKEGSYEEQLDLLGEPKVSGALASNGDIELTGSGTEPVIIRGDVHVGPESTLTEGEGSIITGAATALPELVDAAPVEIPTFSPSPTELTVGSEMPQLLSGEDTEHGKVVVEEGGVLVLRGPLNIVVDELVVESGGELVIDNTEGEVNLFSRNAFLLEGGSDASTTSTDPWRFRLRVGTTSGQAGESGTGSESSSLSGPGTTEVGGAIAVTTANEGVVLLGTGELHVIVEAPDTSVTLGSEMLIYGALTGDTVALESGSTVHVDVSTMKAGDMDIKMVADGVLLWEIISLPTQPLLGGDPFETLGVSRTSLAMPYDSHRVLWLELDYVDSMGDPQTWSGWATDADPQMLRQITQVDAFLNSGDVAPVFTKSVTYATTVDGSVVNVFEMRTQ